MSKNESFSKGVNPWFWSKYGHFSNLFFKAILVRKMTFTIIQNEKAPLQAIKTRSSRIRKIDIFPKGLTHGFGINMAIFRTFFFSALQVRKRTFSIFQIEKTPFQAIKLRSSKSRKIEVFRKGLTHGFGPNMAIFPTFVLGNIGQGNDFYDILERKTAFLGNKNKKFPKT